MSITYKNENIPHSRIHSSDYDVSLNPKQSMFTIDLRPFDLGIEAQGSVGSCVGNAIASAVEVMTNVRNQGSAVNLSRLFLYYNARVLEDSDTTDSGASIRNGLRGARHFGLCTEGTWPYVEENFDNKPPPEAYCEAAYRTIVSFKRIRGNDSLVSCLNAQKPVIIGIDLYENFNRITAENPIYTTPSPEDQYIGSHAMLVMGYSSMTGLWLVKNSFGTDWGENGYCYLSPILLFNGYVFEMWTLEI